MKKIIIGTLLSFALVFSFAGGAALASDHFVSPDPFTQNELDTNWEADRYFPTDGVTSVTAFGRDEVARIGVDSGETQSGTFQRTEGIKTVGDQNFGDAVEVDLYLDPDWEDKATRAGFWVVGDDGTGTARDNWFGIIEFVNLEPSTSGDSAAGDHEGWRIWDSTNGWTNLDTEFSYGEWVTLGIELDTDEEEYNFYINGSLEGSGPAGENFIRELFLNSYNYGLDEFPNLSSDSYAAHWHVGVPIERSAEITAPEAGEEVSGMVSFEAHLVDDDVDSISWAVREGTCAAGTNTIFGNVDGHSDTATIDTSNLAMQTFSFTGDMSGMDAGMYCFIYNPAEDSGEEGIRETVEFMLKDTVAPLVTIESPEDDDTVSGMVEIYGTVEDDHLLSHYNISVYPGDADFTDFSERIAQETVYLTESFKDELIFEWDSTAWDDGEYLIRLAARDAEGNRDLDGDPYLGGDDSQHVITIIVDNTSDPVIETPTDTDDCKKGGWKTFTDPEFKNQGQCVSYVMSNENSRHHR